MHYLCHYLLSWDPAGSLAMDHPSAPLYHLYSSSTSLCVSPLRRCTLPGAVCSPVHVLYMYIERIRLLYGWRHVLRIVMSCGIPVSGSARLLDVCRMSCSSSLWRARACTTSLEDTLYSWLYV